MSNKSAYAQAGVDIEAGTRATQLMKTAVQATYTPQVLSETGAFGGLFDVSHFHQMKRPVLVASTDGVGTKTKVASHMGKWGTVGQDLVNHCINDILVQGARPLFFLDYVASSKLDAEQIATIVNGVATACQAAGCALLGGETAEMPGVYETGEIDLVGTVIGVVEHDQILDGSRVEVGDAILALPATGLHTNGFSLARKVLADLDWQAEHEGLGESVGDALLAIHRCYLAEVETLWQANIDIRGLAHITGGGVVDNLPRILPEGTAAHIERGQWPENPIFKLIQEKGEIVDKDMFHAFNMGLGMLVIIPATQVEQAKQALNTAIYEVGRIVTGTQEVVIQ